MNNLDKYMICGTQRTREWYRARLGLFTGSNVGRLMKRGRGKDAEWSADALAYIGEVAAERMLNPVVVDVDNLFDQYIEATDITNRAMRWGIDHEDEAIDAFTAVTGKKVESCGTFRHPVLECFADSPDGLIADGGVIEIKCPGLKQHMVNAYTVVDNETLKAENEQYYWQTMAHMAVTGAKYCAWVSYNPFAKPSIIVSDIWRDRMAISQLLQRVALADEAVESRIDIIRANGVERNSEKAVSHDNE